MIYFGIAVVVIALAGLLFFIRWLKEPALPYCNEIEFRSFTLDLRARAAALTIAERQVMIEETRRLAKAGYDRLFEAAKQTGKDDAFAHQAGVLDAVFCVFANDDRMRKHEGIRELMRLETIPFNLSPAKEGKPAIVEYLVWKIFPQDAELNVINKAVQRFVDKLLDDAEQDENPDKIIHQWIHSGMFDWQQLASHAFAENANHIGRT